ncbi:MAG: hypothetical protein Q8927_05815 [Bacteroidota bacterium]|nr:hypothetical protein [Bacteroidota bacterium]MDP4215699.1 hypothetical protein [Bacteroidota bacterium]MDP4247441.1 hypothetical protein [Bacteroidota bacterium]MDP4260130.1 hypothetical protein [Bacteroidota bacterium]
MKIFFRFPELWLLLAMLLPPFIVGNRTIDIQLHDTFYVFGSYSYGLNVFFLPVILILSVTWLAHILSRKYYLVSIKWRWLQVGVTLICLSVMTIAICSLAHRTGAFNWGMLTLLFVQLVFWVAVVISAVRKALKQTKKGAV